jgi:hypothetical protein
MRFYLIGVSKWGPIQNTPSSIFFILVLIYDFCSLQAI